MGDFKLKIVIGEAQIELEGDGELVHTIFQEVKDTGLGKLAPLVQAGQKSATSPPSNSPGDVGEDTPDTPDEPLPELPSLQDVVLQGKPKTESEWLLVYAAYASNWGRNLFTREDLRAKYTETKRATSARNKNFATNLKSLSTAHYISANNDTDFRLNQPGIQKAKDIVLGDPSNKKANKSAGSAPKRAPSMYKIFLKNLIPKYLNSSKWNTSRNMDKNIDKVKKYGDLSAHNRRFQAKKSDIDDFKFELRQVVQEMVLIIDYPSWNRKQ